MNKQNYAVPVSNHWSTSQDSKTCKSNKNLCKSVQELLKLKKKVYRNGDQYHCSHGMAVGQKIKEYNKIEYLGDKFNNNQRQILGVLRRQSQQTNMASTIDMLKRQVELLDLEQNLGTIHKFSTLEHQQNTPKKHIFLQVTKFRKQNVRKIAKGRPQLYNWVKNYKKQIAQLQYDYNTQVLKKFSRGELKQFSYEKCEKNQKNQKQQKLGKSNIGKDKANQSCPKSRRPTFLQRLKKLQTSKNLPKQFQARRVRSQNQQQRQQHIILKTLC